MEIINLDMTPSTVTPNAHAGQYDASRTIRFMLKNGGVPFTLAGTETITAEITRSDNTEVTVNVANTSSNYVDVVFDDTVCTVKGLYACELRLKDSDGFDIGSKNFALLVQRDPYDGAGVVVETVGPADICTFETTLPEPLQSVIVDIVATGGNGTPDSPIPINGYTEANITRCGVNLADGDRIADFIVDNVTGASKDTVNKTVTYQASNIRNVVVFDHFKANTQYTFFIDTESGLPNLKIVYTDNTETELNVGVIISTSGKSVKSLSGSWQSGITVLKYDEFGIMEGVKTLSDFTPYTGNTHTIAFGQTVYGGVLDVTRGKLTVTHGYKALSELTWYYNASKKIFYSQSLQSELKAVAGVNVYNFLCDEYNAVSVNTLYNNEPDNSIAIGYIYSDKNVNVIDNNYTDATTFKNNVTGHIAYELATPFDIDLTPEVISAIVGTNNVYSNTNGDTTVQYKDSIQHYIDSRV